MIKEYLLVFKSLVIAFCLYLMADLTGSVRMRIAVVVWVAAAVSEFLCYIYWPKKREKKEKKKLEEVDKILRATSMEKQRHSRLN